MAGAEIERMVVRLLGDASNYEQALKRSGKATQTFAQRATRQLKTVSQGMKNLGRSLSFRVTAPLTLLGIGAIKVGADFQKGFTGVRKTVDATEEEFVKLRKGFKDMSLEVPLAIEELLKLGEVGGQLGIAKENILDFSRVMAALGVSTNLASEEAATAFAQIANITKLPQTQFENLGSALVALGNDTATSESKIVNMSTRIAGSGTAAGLSTDQIFGFAASLSSVGQTAEAGGTSFSKFILKMKVATKLGGEQLERFADVAGVTSAEFTKRFERDAAGSVVAFLKSLEDLGSDKLLAIAGLGITDQRSISMLLASSNAVDKFTKNLNLSKKSFDENVALAEEAAKAYKTFWSQLTLLKNQMKALLDDVFILMEPALRGIIRRVKGLITWLGRLSPETKRTAVIIGVILGTIGPLLIVTGSLIGVIALLVNGVRVLGIAFLAMGVKAQIGWAMATLGISLLIPVIAGVVFGLIKLQKETGVFDPLIKAVQELRREFMSELWPAILDIWKLVKRELTPVFKELFALVEEGIRTLVGLIPLLLVTIRIQLTALKVKLEVLAVVLRGLVELAEILNKINPNIIISKMILRRITESAERPKMLGEAINVTKQVEMMGFDIMLGEAINMTEGEPTVAKALKRDLAPTTRRFSSARLEPTEGPTGVQAAQVGTAEAQARIMAFKSGTGEATEAKRTADNTERIADTLEKIDERGESLVGGASNTGLRRS